MSKTKTTPKTKAKKPKTPKTTTTPHLKPAKNNLKHQVYRIVRPTTKKGLPGKIFDGVMIFLILADIGFSIVLTFDGISEPWPTIATIVSQISVIFFLVDYLLRIWTADLQHHYKNKTLSRLKYIFSFWGIIDLLAFLPFCIPFLPSEMTVLKVFRVLRIFDIFELKQNNDAVSIIIRTLSAKKGQILSSFLIIGTLMIAASLVMYDVEHATQPEAFSNAFSGLWWATSAIFTVGYGDVYPITDLGRVVSMIISILGVALVAIPTGILSAGFIEQSEKRRQNRK